MGHSRARTLEAGKRWARLAQARAASRPGLCATAPNEDNGFQRPGVEADHRVLELAHPERVLHRGRGVVEDVGFLTFILFIDLVLAVLGLYCCRGFSLVVASEGYSLPVGW